MKYNNLKIIGATKDLKVYLTYVLYCILKYLFALTAHSNDDKSSQMGKNAILPHEHVFLAHALICVHVALNVICTHVALNVIFTQVALNVICTHVALNVIFTQVALNVICTHVALNVICAHVALTDESAQNVILAKWKYLLNISSHLDA